MPHFLYLTGPSPADLRAIVDTAVALKARWRKGDRPKPLADRALAMIFEKPSTRTRLSFDLAMRQLGGFTSILNPTDMQLGRGETIEDTARVLSRYVDVIMLRALAHDSVTRLADAADVPVINGLTDRAHPCQLMADLLTVQEWCGGIEGVPMAWVGDVNNVAASTITAARAFGFPLAIAHPEAPPVPDWIQAHLHDGVTLTQDPVAAVKDARVIITDTWVSMGDTDADAKRAALKPYTVDQALMHRAAPDAMFLHCLPAYRGQEVTAEVIDGPRSAAWDEAENRLHAQKAVLLWCLDALDSVA